MNKISTRNEPSIRYLARLVLENLVQVIWIRILLGMNLLLVSELDILNKTLVQVILSRILLGVNLVQDFELDLFYYLSKNSTRNEPSTRFWAIFVLEKPSPSYLKRILIVMNLVQD